MITISAVDRLVVQDDAALARVWSQLGERLRTAYVADRDAWTALRRGDPTGRTIDQKALLAQQQVFSGWSRALRLAAQRRRPATAKALPPPATPSPAVAPTQTSAAVTKPGGMGGAAIAGAVVLAGIVAVAAGRRRA